MASKFKNDEPPKRPARPRGEPVDPKAAAERTMRRFPKVMAELGK